MTGRAKAPVAGKGTKRRATNSAKPPTANVQGFFIECSRATVETIIHDCDKPEADRRVLQVRSEHSDNDARYTFPPEEPTDVFQGKGIANLHAATIWRGACEEQLSEGNDSGDTSEDECTIPSEEIAKISRTHETRETTMTPDGRAFYKKVVTFVYSNDAKFPESEYHVETTIGIEVKLANLIP